MSCKCAKPTDEYHGWECEVTGGACVFLIQTISRVRNCLEKDRTPEEPDKIE